MLQQMGIPCVVVLDSAVGLHGRFPCIPLHKLMMSVVWITGSLHYG